MTDVRKTEDAGVKAMETIALPRWWVEQACEQLFSMKQLPSGQLGDWAFLFREMLKDILARPRSAPVPQCDAEPVAGWQKQYAEGKWLPVLPQHIEAVKNSGWKVRPLYAAPARCDEPGLDEWIEREFSGHGRALRTLRDPPIDGEPFMSMADAKELTRAAVATFAAPRSHSDAGSDKVLSAFQNNLHEAWAALAMIREAIETLAPVGAMKASEHLDRPTFMHEADEIVKGIVALSHLPVTDEAGREALSIVTILANTDPAEWLSKPEIHAKLKKFRTSDQPQ